MTTTPTTCSYCGVEFTDSNPANPIGHCRDALACVNRVWAKEKAEKQKETNE